MNLAFIGLLVLAQLALAASSESARSLVLGSAVIGGIVGVLIERQSKPPQAVGNL